MIYAYPTFHRAIPQPPWTIWATSARPGVPARLQTGSGGSRRRCRSRRVPDFRTARPDSTAALFPPGHGYALPHAGSSPRTGPTSLVGYQDVDRTHRVTHPGSARRPSSPARPTRRACAATDRACPASPVDRHLSLSTMSLWSAIVMASVRASGLSPSICLRNAIRARLSNGPLSAGSFAARISSAFRLAGGGFRTHCALAP